MDELFHNETTDTESMLNQRHSEDVQGPDYGNWWNEVLQLD